MRRKKFLLPLLLGLLVIVSCSKESTISNKSATDKLNDLGIIPLEQAISTLERFLNESDVSGTKSGKARKISSISTYYSDLTVKSADDSSAIPQAYLINFEDGGGFAVLGANGAVADIVAVTENGAINDDLTVVLSNHPRDDSYQEIADDSEIDNDEDIPLAVQSDTLGFYCSEDDDFYSESNNSENNAKLVELFIKSAVNGHGAGGRDGGDGGDGKEDARRKNNYTYSWHFRLITYNVPAN